MTFSEELRQLAEQFADRPATLATILAATQARGFNLLLVLMTLPFITPIPLPGLSTPFGLVVTLIGARLAVGKKPWLPQWVLNRNLPAGYLAKTLRAASQIVRWLEFILRPRLAFLHEAFVFRRASGSLIMISGVLLLLPVPVPFCNSLPALTILFLAAGALERDGMFFLGGCMTFLVTAAYFLLLTFGGAHVLDGLKDAVFK